MRTRSTCLTDDELRERVKRHAQCEREATATLIADLGELGRRRLHLADGYPSLFVYCTQALHLSEQAAYLRIRAAKASLRFPAILEELESGALNLTTIKLLVPHLTPKNCAELLAAARYQSKRNVELLIARLNPQPDVPARITRSRAPARTSMLGEGSTSPDAFGLEPTGLDAPIGLRERESTGPINAPVAWVERQAARQVIAPLAPDRYEVRFTASGAMHDKLRRLQDLLRHRVPNGELSRVFELAVDALLEKVEKEKLAATSRPRAGRGVKPGSRTIPAAVKREVWKRDGGRCAFVASNRRCGEPGFLEFHHVWPFGVGGEATPRNIELRCRAHNQYEAMLDFGPWKEGSGRRKGAARMKGAGQLEDAARMENGSRRRTATRREDVEVHREVRRRDDGDGFVLRESFAPYGTSPVVHETLAATGSGPSWRESLRWHSSI